MDGTSSLWRLGSGGMLHSNVATANARLFFLFIEPGAANLPDRCCTLSLSPLVRELIIEMADQSAVAMADAELITTLLLSALPRMPVEDLHLPLTDEPRLGRTRGHWSTILPTVAR